MSVSFSLFKYSRSEVVLTFFERSPLDQVLKNDNVHKIQPSFQSPVKISGNSCWFPTLDTRITKSKWLYLLFPLFFLHQQLKR